MLPAALPLYFGCETTLGVEDEVSRWVRGCGKLAIMGIGNPLRKDDGVGVEIVKRLAGKVSKRVRLFDCGMVPEEFLSDIEAFQPTHVLIIDAADLKSKPGEARLIPPQKVEGTMFSSHAVPIPLLVSMIGEAARPQIAVLGIQPFDTEFGEGLSSELQAALKSVVEAITEALK
jgi:hydrogenase 3 maturation protease